jgi:hypothetical protein
MAGFGICSSNEKRCGLSYESPRVSRLFGLIRTIHQRRSSGNNADDLLPHLTGFVDFFQEGISCRQCGGDLVLVTKATAGLPEGNPERNQAEQQNEALQAGYEMQGFGILRI